VGSFFIIFLLLCQLEFLRMITYTSVMGRSCSACWPWSLDGSWCIFHWYWWPRTDFIPADHASL